MCGIIGTAPKNNKIGNSLKYLSHRGPDGHGVFEDDKVALGHTRLAILDLSDKGRQPMTEESSGTVLTYNGEIYNFKELKRDLIQRGRIFKSESDTEVILNGYLEYGTSFFSRLRGMWAFAIYNKKRGVLVLSCDCFGIKPLYYAVKNGSLSFASEIKALTSLVGPVSPNTDYYFQFFNLGYFIAPQTCYKEIKKLEPGAVLVWDIKKGEGFESKIRLEEETGVDYPLSFNEAVEALDKELSDSVNSHFISDVPVGLLLSGGNDSSLLAALSKETGFNPVAYNLSIGNNSDSEYARKVAKHLNLKLVREEVSENALAEQYEKAWEVLQEPFADISIIPTSLIFSVIKKDAKVVLSGEGGDELFGGYLRCRKLAEKTAMRRNNTVLTALNAVSRGGGRISLEVFNPAVNRLKGVMLDDFQNDIIGSYLKGVKLADHPISDSAIRKSLYDFYVKFKGGAKDASRNLFFDRFLYLPNNLMYKGDISSMHYSVEARVPFLDKQLFNFVVKKINPKFCLSREYKDKIILKKVLEKYLPKELVYRSKKGFAFSFKDHSFSEFQSDVKEAMRFHQKNALAFGFKKTGLLNPSNADIMIRKYDRFAFALVSNWKIFKNII